ncbi:hypothetical protein MY11210_000410 [Beauveria gryllotalpidicola]
MYSAGLSLGLAAAWLAGACQSRDTTLASQFVSSLQQQHGVAVDELILQRRTLETVLDQVPSCAKSCLEPATTNDACADATCLCSNTTVEKKLQSCVSAVCTMAESITTMNQTQATCDLPPRDRATAFNVTSITLCAVTGVMVFARLIFKVFYSYAAKLGLDDWFIIISICVGLPCTIINSVGLTGHGLGKDVWTLTPDVIETFARYFYAQQILYLFLVTTVKLSLLFFYLSIFPGTGVRALLWVTLVVTALFGLTFMLLSVFQCMPVAFYWMRYIQPIHGHCTRINLLAWIHGSVSVAIDVWMIGIPLFQIRKLELHWKKKVGAAIMFLTGGFVTVVSALRLRSLIYFANSINPTWDELPVALWATVEINVGLMCACLPTLRLILVRIWPRVFGSTMRSASERSAVSHATNASARKAKLRMASVDTEESPITPRLQETDTAYELEAKYPTWEDRGDADDNAESVSIENACHAR